MTRFAGATFGRPNGLALVTFLALGGAALAVAVSPSVAQSTAQRPVYKDRAQPVTGRVEDLLARMTLEEKVAQLVTIWEHKDRV